MTVYMVRCRDGDGNPVGTEWIEADDDVEAFYKAAALKVGLHRDVWDGTRLVLEIEMDTRDPQG